MPLQPSIFPQLRGETVYGNGLIETSTIYRNGDD